MEKLEPYSSNADHRDLTEEEIEAFFNDIDTDNDGVITIDELEAKLEAVHDEIAPQPKSHHLHHPIRRSRSTVDTEIGPEHPEHDNLLHFLNLLLPGCKQEIGKQEFVEHVRTWHIPSQDQSTDDNADAREERALPLLRRLRARWSVDGHKFGFIMCVTILTLGLSIWQGVKYIYSPDIRAALGWGVIMAKFCAGALYSITFFLLLSMSRIFSTFMRRFYHFSRFVNWDRSQSFHIWMACFMLVLSTLHGIAHMTGTFLTGSQSWSQPAVRALYNDPSITRSYSYYFQALPGWSGAVSLGMIWIISLCSVPWVRKKSYELFQLTHLLMFPLMGLLAAHGTAQILGQYPMLGFWLLLPGLLVIFERSRRIIRGFFPHTASLKILDDDTVVLTCIHSKGTLKGYAAGQYALLQVPDIAFFQWHPFTISACSDEKIQFHIKTDGNWTERLRDLPSQIKLGIDGPFGAPAQRFYDFDKSIIIGSGIGVTPFSAIVTDLEQDLTQEQDPWVKSRRNSSAPGARSRRPSDAASRVSELSKKEFESALDRGVSKLDEVDTTSSDDTATARGNARGQSYIDQRKTSKCGLHAKYGPQSEKSISTKSRRVDFHWMVRDKVNLLWFSSLLNRAYDLAETTDLHHISAAPLDLNIYVHITAKRKNISTHIFRYLLDSYRTKSAPYSALTGLKTRSNFGRPDLPKILAEYHEDLVKAGVRNEKVGVFFCGASVIGSILADACQQQTAMSRQDGHKIRYIFMMEVFG